MSNYLSIQPALKHFFDNITLPISPEVDLMKHFPSLRRGYTSSGTSVHLMNSYILIHDLTVFDNIFVAAFGADIPPYLYRYTDTVVHWIPMQKARESGLIPYTYRNTFEVMAMFNSKFDQTGNHTIPINDVEYLAHHNTEYISATPDKIYLEDPSFIAALDDEATIAQEIYGVLRLMKWNKALTNPLNIVDIMEYALNTHNNTLLELLLLSHQSDMCAALFIAIRKRDLRIVNQHLTMVDARHNDYEAYHLVITVHNKSALEYTNTAYGIAWEINNKKIMRPIVDAIVMAIIERNLLEYEVWKLMIGPGDDLVLDLYNYSRSLNKYFYNSK